MDLYSFIISSEHDCSTVRHILRTQLQMADGLISSLKFRACGLALNGRPVHVNAVVHAGDTLTVRMDDDGCNPAAPLDIEPDICYEDDFFAIVNKPPGTAVYGEPGPNLAGEFCKKWGSNIPFHPVNRLDVGTSGLLVVARSRYMHDRLRRLLHTKSFRREYLAVCDSIPENQEGSITLPIGKTPDDLGNHSVAPDGLPCRTDYRVIRSLGNRALVQLQLYTGRTHQIRVHMAAIGCPLLGDKRYGRASPLISRHALHSYRITLLHPMTNELLDITAPLPEDILHLIPPD